MQMRRQLAQNSKTSNFAGNWSQLFEKTSSRNIKLTFLAFNMQWLFGSILEPTTKIIFLDTFCSQNP